MTSVHIPGKPPILKVRTPSPTERDRSHPVQQETQLCLRKTLAPKCSRSVTSNTSKTSNSSPHRLPTFSLILLVRVYTRHTHTDTGTHSHSHRHRHRHTHTHTRFTRFRAKNMLCWNSLNWVDKDEGNGDFAMEFQSFYREIQDTQGRRSLSGCISPST